MQFQSQSNQPYSYADRTPLTPEGQRALEEMAQRHGFSMDAVRTLLDAVNNGNGSAAQFSHWEFGGMGQWSYGGMIMIGDMFNNGLKYRVSSLCTDLSNLLRNITVYQPLPPIQNGNGSFWGGSTQWPAEFGSPSSSGAQNNMKYAYFPAARRLCVQMNGHTRIFDTLNHQIGGVSQQQGSDQSLTFNSQFGTVRTLDLPEILQGNASAPLPPAPAPAPQAMAPASFQPNPPYQPPVPAPSMQGSNSADEIFKLIERLAELHQKNLLTQEEFASKKAELLNRL